MHRLKSILHPPQKPATNQRPKVPQNGHPIAPVKQASIESNNALKAMRPSTPYNAQFYGDDDILLPEGALASRQRIRLLQIDPGDYQTEVSCHFLNYSLQQHPDYDALSYCWGSQSAPERRTISVNDRPGFHVTRHLLQALRRLRRKDRVRLVWIDAVCINQSNVKERNHQVQVMRSIYSQARGVIVLLGEISGESQPPCEKHPSVFDRDQLVCVEPGLSAFEHQDVEKVFRQKVQMDDKNSLRRSSLGEVWWKRIWVLQEFAASRSLPTVYFGPHAVRWQFFAELLWGEKDHLFSKLRDDRQSSLYGLLCTTYKSFYATEPRDKIYALLGLLDQNPDVAIFPDYAKSDAEVYEDTTYYLIRTEWTLDILFDCRTQRTWGDIPSWIPDLSQIKPRKDTETKDSYQASGQSRPSAKLEDHTGLISSCQCLTRKVLRLQGLHFDTVGEKFIMSDCTKQKKFLSSLKVNWGAILDILLSPITCEPPPSTDPRSRLDRRTCMGYLLTKYVWEDRVSVVAEIEKKTRHEREFPSNKYHGKSQEELRKLIPVSYYNIGAEEVCSIEVSLYEHTRSQGIKITKTLEENLHIAARSEHDLFDKMTNSQNKKNHWMPMDMRHATLFATGYSFVGLGPPDLQKGDRIVTLFGASRPYVLRNHGDHHVLVGDVVVPGIMSGQMMPLYDDGSIKVEDFLLK